RQSPTVPDWRGQTEDGCPWGDASRITDMPDSSRTSIGVSKAMRWLSEPRYRRYLDIADGDHELAMETYLWNSRVAAAGIVDVGHLEIALRNAYDRELSRRFSDWTIDPQSQLFHREQGVQRARVQQRRQNQASLARIAGAKRGLSSA